MTSTVALDTAAMRRAAAALAAAGVPSPDHDARRLAEHAAATGASFDDLIVARAARVPLQHITGTAYFRHLELAVGAGVFVPRPETELLVDAVLSGLAGVEDPVVVDLCAGSGAIGFSICHEHPTATVHLVERSADAFTWLAHNRERLAASASGRAVLHRSDLMDRPCGLDGKVDVVVSNPPYLPRRLRQAVDPEVRDHDPDEALWVDGDGLAVIAQVAARAMTLVKPGGLLVVEHADGQGESVMKLLQDKGFADVRDHRDLAGRPRFATAVTPC